MFREMRRSKQALMPEECAAVLMRNTSCVLAVSGDDGYPYAVPLSYVFDGERIFVHCAKDGHKIDALKRNDKVSLCVIDCNQVVPQEYTTYYRSVIVFGRARILEDEAEKRRALQALAAKYAPDDEEGRLAEVEKTLGRVCMVEILPEYSTGKESIELHREKYPRSC